MQYERFNFKSPVNLRQTTINLVGLYETEEYLLIHDLGFACEQCKPKDGKPDVKICDWKIELFNGVDHADSF